MAAQKPMGPPWEPTDCEEAGVLVILMTSRHQTLLFVTITMTLFPEAISLSVRPREEGLYKEVRTKWKLDLK